MSAEQLTKKISHEINSEKTMEISPLLRKATEMAEREERRRKELEEILATLKAQLETTDPEREHIIDSLSEKDQNTVRQEMTEQAPLEFESEDAATDPETFLENEVVKSTSGIQTSERMKKIIRKLRAGALFGVGVVALWLGYNQKEKRASYVQPRTLEGEVSSVSTREMNEQTILKNPEKKEPASLDKETLEQLPQNARDIYLYSINNVNSSYIIIDKPSAKMYVIGNDKKLIASFPVLLGKVRGEHENTANPDDDNAGPGATTPAGKYLISHNIVASDSITYRGKAFSVYDLKGKPQIGIHSTYPGELETRTHALGTEDIGDNRITWGCINLDEENFNKYLKGKIDEDAILFITPDDPNTIIDPHTGSLLNRNKNS